MATAANADVEIWDISHQQHPTGYPDGRFVALEGPNIDRLHGLDDAQLLRTLVALRNGPWAVVAPDGHWRGEEDCGDELVYVVETGDGPKAVSPAGFATQYGWKTKTDQRVRSCNVRIEL